MTPSMEGEHEGDIVPVDEAEAVSAMSTPEELLAYIHDLGSESDKEIASSFDSLMWDEL